MPKNPRVIPAEAGIYLCIGTSLLERMDPRLRGDDKIAEVRIIGDE